MQWNSLQEKKHEAKLHFKKPEENSEFLHFLETYLNFSFLNRKKQKLRNTEIHEEIPGLRIYFQHFLCIHYENISAGFLLVKTREPQ